MGRQRLFGRRVAWGILGLAVSLSLTACVDYYPYAGRISVDPAYEDQVNLLIEMVEPCRTADEDVYLQLSEDPKAEFAALAEAREESLQLMLEAAERHPKLAVGEFQQLTRVMAGLAVRTRALADAYPPHTPGRWPQSKRVETLSDSLDVAEGLAREKCHPANGKTVGSQDRSGGPSVS